MKKINSLFVITATVIAVVIIAAIKLREVDPMDEIDWEDVMKYTVTNQTSMVNFTATKISYTDYIDTLKPEHKDLQQFTAAQARKSLFDYFEPRLVSNI